MLGRLNDTVLFGVEAAADLVPFPRRDTQFFTKAPDLGTVADTRWHPVIAGSQNVFVLNKNRTHLSPQTSGTGGDQPGDLHEIFVPCGACQRLTQNISGLEPVAVERELFAKLPDLTLDLGQESFVIPFLKNLTDPLSYQGHLSFLHPPGGNGRCA